jgi:hypothetical protein
MLSLHHTKAASSTTKHHLVKLLGNNGTHPPLNHIMDNPKTNNDDPSLEPLHKTIEALNEIKSNLLPFLRLLKDDDERNKQHHNKTKESPKKKKRSHPDDFDDIDKKQSSSTSQILTPHKRAEAEAAVALAIGTLRYMGSRLRGLDRGRKKGDPLRVELDKIRGMLVSLRKLESSNDTSKKEGDDVGEKKGAIANIDAATKKDGIRGTKRENGGVINSGGVGEKVPTSKKQRR